MAKKSERNQQSFIFFRECSLAHACFSIESTSTAYVWRWGCLCASMWRPAAIFFDNQSFVIHRVFVSSPFPLPFVRAGAAPKCGDVLFASYR